MSSPPQRQTFSFFNLISSIRGGANTPHGATSPAPSGANNNGSAAANRPYSSVAAAAAASQSNAVSTSTSPTNQPAAASSSPHGATTTPSTSPVTRSGTTSITIPIPRRRGSNGSDGSTGGYIERPGPPMYIGGKLDTGEVKFYKLGLMRAKMSDTSLDRMSL